MIAIAVNGSVRENGNTHHLLEKVLEPLNEAGWKTDLIQLGGKNIHGCRACYHCFTKKDFKCAYKDDVFNDIAEKCFSADALIFGTPTYFTDVSAEMKCLLDRLGLVAIANNKALKGKIGAAVVAVRRGGGTHAFDSINHMFLMSGVIVPGSAYWNLGFGRNPGEVLQDNEGIANMQHLGKTIAWLGSCIKDNIKNYPDFSGKKDA